MRKVVYIVLRDGKDLCWMDYDERTQTQATTSRKKAQRTAAELNRREPRFKFTWHPCLIYVRAQ